MSANPIERVALDAIEFLEDLTANPLLDSEDVEMDLDDVQAHAGIEAVSLRKRLRAALEAEASEGERRGLERAAKVADEYAMLFAETMETHANAKPGVINSTRPLLAVSKSIAEACARRIRALIPEAPAREGE